MTTTDRNQFNNGGGQAHPLTRLVSGLADAWSQGIEVLLEMAGLATTVVAGGADTAAAGMPEGLQPSAEFLESIVPGAAELSEAAQAGQVALTRALELSPALAQAYIVCAGSTVRYCGTVAELLIRHEASLLKAAADRVTGNNPEPAAECRIIADDLRAFLREVGEAAMGEARRLEHDLAIVGESIARTTDRATPSPRPHHQQRMHEVKP